MVQVLLSALHEKHLMYVYQPLLFCLKTITLLELVTI